MTAIGFCTCVCGERAAVFVTLNWEEGDIASSPEAECVNGHMIPVSEMHLTFEINNGDY